MITEILNQIPHLKAHADALAEEFGPYADHAWLSFLVMGTGCAGCPVSARLVGGQADIQDMIARSVRRQMPERTSFLRWPKLSQLIKAMDAKEGRPHSLILRGVPTRLAAEDPVLRMLRGHIEGTETGVRERSQPSVLILEGDGITDVEVQKNLVTIVMTESEEGAKHLARLRLRQTLSRRKTMATAGRFDLDLLRKPSRFEDLEQIKMAYSAAEKRQSGLSMQLAQYLNIVDAHARLMTSHDAELEVAVGKDHMDQVLELYRACGVPSNICELSTPATTCLRVLQRYEKKKQLVVGEKHRLANPKLVPGNFTAYDIVREPEYRGLTVDAAKKWFKELRSMGLLVDGKKGENNKSTYSLTPLGHQWGERLLADLLAACLALPDNSDSLSNPTNSNKE